MAEALVWQLVRDNNSFLVKRGRTRRDGAVQFSTEPGNLLGVNTFKYSGLANNNSIAVTPRTIRTKNAKDLAKVSKSVNTNDFKLNRKAGLKALADLSASSYRSDLASAAKARYLKVYKVHQIQKGLVKGARKSTTRGSR